MCTLLDLIHSRLTSKRKLDIVDSNPSLILSRVRRLMQKVSGEFRDQLERNQLSWGDWTRYDNLKMAAVYSLIGQLLVMWLNTVFWLVNHLRMAAARIQRNYQTHDLSPVFTPLKYHYPDLIDMDDDWRYYRLDKTLAAATDSLLYNQPGAL